MVARATGRLSQLRVVTLVGVGALILIDVALHSSQADLASVHSFQADLASTQRTQRCVVAASKDDLLLRAKKVAGKQRSLLLVFVREEQSDIVSNFVATASAAGITNRLLAVALDERSAARLQHHGVEAHLAEDGDDAALVGAVGRSEGGHLLSDGTLASARQLRALRWRYLAALAQSGLDVWLSDVRVLWLRSPFAPPSSWQHPAGCELALTSRRSLGLGFYRASAGVGRWQRRMAQLVEEEGADETALLSSELDRCGEAHSSSAQPLANRSECVRWCALPPALFPNGRQYFQQRLPQSASSTEQLVAVLADEAPNNQLRYRLREEGLWRLDHGPAEAGERFLAFKELVIDNGLSNTRGALRSALAVAHLTNRTLILPQVADPSLSVAHVPTARLTTRLAF